MNYHGEIKLTFSPRQTSWRLIGQMYFSCIIELPRGWSSCSYRTLFTFRLQYDFRNWNDSGSSPRFTSVYVQNIFSLCFILIPSCIWMKGKQRRSDPEDRQNRSGSVLRPAGSPPPPPSIHAASIDLLLIVVNASAFAVLWNWILIVLLYRQGLGIVRRSIYYCWLKSIIFFYVSALNKIALF